MDAGPLAALAGFVVVGAAMQRITGMGFALVASPLLVLVLGPRLGVQLTQVLGVVAAGLVLTSLWPEVEVRKALVLFACAVIGIVPGSLVSQFLPAPVLAVLVGAMIVVALGATVLSERARVFTGTKGLVGAGFLSGFMNVTAAVGGPAIVLYALSTRWKHSAFVATLQLYFVLLSVGSLTAIGWPELDGRTWVVSFAALGVGLVAGHVLSRRVHASTARVLVLVVAFAGAIATIVKGLLSM